MAQGRKTTVAILLTPKERQTLESWLRSTTICHGQARRARIILLLADRVAISETFPLCGHCPWSHHQVGQEVPETATLWAG